MKSIRSFLRLVPGLMAGFSLLIFAGCASPSSRVQNASATSISPSLALNYIQVVTFSSLSDLTVEKRSLSDAVISSLNDTGLFQTVSADAPTNSPVNGIKVVAEIKEIKKVSDDARTWIGTWAGQAQVLVRVTVSDLNTGAQVKIFEVEGKSGKSARAGTTDEAIEMAGRRITAEIVRINSQTSD